MPDFYIEYSDKPRYIDEINIDADVAASHPRVIADQQISDPVTGIDGYGYQPGQKNLDGSPL